ncbi:MAG: hypothetical protein WAL50_08585 [Kineosporiaceae bacterium]|jgi:hypothetical protein
MSLAPLGVLAAAIDLSGEGNYLTWGWFSISWGNLAVIITMLVVFVLALVLPFPGSKP